MSDPFPWLRAALADLAARGLRRERRTVRPLPGGRSELHGRILRNFATNDYLDLAGDPRLIAAARAALEECGTGARASALVVGRTEWHARLEARLARFERQPACLLFPTGQAANVGTITALVGPGDVVHCDRANHASLVDGCRMSGAQLRVYRHDRLERLEQDLRRAARGRRLVVTDSIFSMDGDAAPLRDLCELAERFGAPLMVDEAHGTGVFGAEGRGWCEEAGVEERVAVRVGTCSKALGSLGGFVAGSDELVEWLWNTARTQMFSTALPPSACAATIAALDVVETEPERRTRLRERSAWLRDRLHGAGLDLPAGVVGPIVPVVLGEPAAAVAASRRLAERGFLVPAIRPPTVPRGTARLRISLTAAHSEQDVADLAAAVIDVCEPRLRSALVPATSDEESP